MYGITYSLYHPREFKHIKVMSNHILHQIPPSAWWVYFKVFAYLCWAGAQSYINNAMFMLSVHPMRYNTMSIYAFVTLEKEENCISSLCFVRKGQ